MRVLAERLSWRAPSTCTGHKPGVRHVTNIEKWLPCARLRPHVVLKLIFDLVDRKYPMGQSQRRIQQLKEELQQRVERMYPDSEGHLPENERQGTIPPAVLQAIARAARDPPGPSDSKIQQKHATPAEAPDTMDVILETVRPSIVLADRDSRILERKEECEIMALEQLAAKRVPVLRARTSVDLVDQWRWDYVPLAYCHSLPRVVGGADYPLQKRGRRDCEAAHVDPWDYLGMHARRVEANIKTDWNLVPAQRSLTTKWSAVCGDQLACRHAVDREKPKAVLAAELCTIASGLYKRLRQGF